jgi:hypothetical protein
VVRCFRYPLGPGQCGRGEGGGGVDAPRSAGGNHPHLLNGTAAEREGGIDFSLYEDYCMVVATFSWFSSLNSLIQDKKYFIPSLEYTSQLTTLGGGGWKRGGGSVEN